MRTPVAVLLAMTLILATCGGQEKGRKGFANVGDVYADVTVLNVLYLLQPTPKQMEAMRKAAAKSSAKPPPRKLIKVSEKLRKTMTSLREALASGDDEKIESLFKAFDELRDKEDPDFDDVEITDAARRLAPSIVRQLSARQVAIYVAGVADFPDPVELLLELMDESRKLSGKEWQLARDDAAYQIGWLVGGLNEKAEEKARDQATSLLNKAARLNQKQYEAQRAALTQEASAIVGQLGPTDVIRHFVERVLAETLSSHRFLTAADLFEKNRARKK